MPRRITSEASAATVSAVSAGRTRTVPGSTTGARASLHGATPIPGSGGGRFPPPSRTSSRTGTSGPAGSNPSRVRERTSEAIVPGLPGMPFTDSEPLTASEKPIRICFRLDGTGPCGGAIHRATGGMRSGMGPVRNVVAKARLRPVGSMTARPLRLRMPVPTTTA